MQETFFMPENKEVKMQNKERIAVFIKYENEKTVCICKRSNKLCDHPCEVEIVERDKFYDIKKVFSQDKYGKSKI